jgi:hypothetical protein
MSKMIPPFYNPAFVKSDAERALFNRLRDEAGTEEWTVLHSLALGEHIRQRAGEVDFLLITPLGVFIIEVKGGIVRRETGLWIYGSSPEDRTEKPRGPFEQARDNMFSLEKRLREKGSRLSKLFFGYGVYAPDCSLKACVSRNESADNPGVVYDFDDRRSSLTEYIKRLATEATRYYSAAGITDRFRPSAKDAQELVSLLRGDFEAEVSELSLARDVSRNILLLEESQRRAIDSFTQDERTVLLGAAGTGKTIVALEAAARACQAGKIVLMLAYSKNLSKYLAAQLQDPEVHERLRIIGIHELMFKAVETSPFKADLTAKLSENTQQFWSEWLPDHFSLVQSERGPLCDTLIIDEGQDILTENFLNAIETMVSGGIAQGNWLWCMDDSNQGAVFGRCDDIAKKKLRQAGVTMRLGANIRNTKAVTDAAQKLTSPSALANTSLIGPDVSYFRVQDKKAARLRLLSVLNGFLEAGVSPGQITVLSEHKTPSWDFEAVASALPSVAWLNDDLASRFADRQPDTITFCTISGFKGFENDFIILTEIDDLISERGRALAYVGMTRARAKLVVLLSPQADEIRLQRA